MRLTEIVVQGTLKPDGTIQLDETPNLSPGRVTIVLRQENAATPSPPATWWQFMRNARKQMEENGCHFMNEKEIGAHIEWLREGDRIDDLLQKADEQEEHSEQP